ncbi:MAG: hypothetical protein L6308_02810 [Candidatus Omnitrophica bacterium]|nr:hypothetical protein [Candidatus Omnitrophota bacterium]
MNKKRLIVTWVFGISLLFLAHALAETVYPISSKKELQSLVGSFNKQKIKMSSWYNDEDINPGVDKTFEKVESVIENGEFFIEGVNGGLKFFKVDINNDGQDEYVKTLEEGSGRFFDIEAVYKNEKDKFEDIYNEIKLLMRKLIRDAEKTSYDLEEGYVGHAFGDMIVEKRAGKVYFTILEGRAARPWEDLNSFNASDKPRAYEFLWEYKKIKLIRVYDRKIEKSDFFVNAALAQGNAADVYIAKGKYWDYYHIKFTLTPKNILLVLKGYDKYGPSKYEFEDGMFQVFIPKDKFPISAPNCKEYIILRMLMTIGDLNKDKFIAEKKVIFNKIKEMKESGKGQVEVIIQLNNSDADIQIKSKDPLALELEGCNVWFRDAHGRYIDYVGELK